jgi:hypothetical protein
MLRPIHLSLALLFAFSTCATTLAEECFFPRQRIPQCKEDDEVCVGLARSLAALNAKIELAEKGCLEKRKPAGGQDGVQDLTTRAAADETHFKGHSAL